MGQIQPTPKSLLIIAVTSRYEEALRWSCDRAIQQWGPIAITSTPFAFSETDYYQKTMGPDLLKQFVAMAELIDPGSLPSIKHLTNQWEEEYATTTGWSESRPLNLDPGYVTDAKLVLASTKNHAHRIYLDSGIYAEVTLYYQGRQWKHWNWTYPDYRRLDYHEFFASCREYYLDHSRR